MTASTASDVLLDVDGVVAGFGPTTVLHGVTFAVRKGEVAGIFGLNGAGKSVTMKVLAGTVPARDGAVRFDGVDLMKVPAEERVSLGMAHVPQGRQVFGALTVEENLRLGAYTLRKRDRARYASVLDGLYDRFPILAERRTQIAGTMSGGQQAALAVARALVADPKPILVDEPSAGLSPMAVQELFVTLRAVADSGVTMVLVEQNVTFGLKVVDTVNVLQTGVVVMTSPVGELDADEMAKALGIGRLLHQGVSAVVGSRAVAVDEVEPRPAKRATTRSTGATKTTAKKAVTKAVTKKAVTKKAAAAATTKTAAKKPAASTKKVTAKKAAAPERAAAKKATKKATKTASKKATNKATKKAATKKATNTRGAA
ncbi:MAG TPA: ABC transporter ATP-binding protein [Acidimicrobiales bacterium]|nr:ABC transporter ATP-binding protein [Acidimicrobiales bacterium]